MDILIWIQNWFSSHCDGDWEHEYGIKIETVDNPGWFITIDLSNTPLSDIVFDMDTVEFDDNNWYFYIIKDSQFKASGDVNKLQFLLEKFKEFVEENS